VKLSLNPQAAQALVQIASHGTFSGKLLKTQGLEEEKIAGHDLNQR
jgi:hypothetical protein